MVFSLWKRFVDVIKSTPQVRVSERVVEQIVDVTVPPVMKEIAEVAKVTRDEHFKLNRDVVHDKVCRDGNIKGVDTCNMLRSGDVTDKIKTLENEHAGRVETGHRGALGQKQVFVEFPPTRTVSYPCTG